MIDLDRALEHLTGPLPSGPWPAGAPAHELLRSPAAARTGRLAADAGLFLLNYEHRVQAIGEPPPEWTDGLLPEPKYEAFRHDLPIGSFHPGHRAKWTAHELAHLLVGFAWAPGRPPLFHATAARLAELVPVVLWYFLDEIGLRRCERHVGPLFRGFCEDCQRAAAEGARPVDEAHARRTLLDADRFLEHELAAVARTARLGRPAPHVWGSLDLCSDGLAYAAAHFGRLESEAFRAFADRFLRPGDPAWSGSLGELEERVVAVARAISEGVPLSLPSGGPERFVRWDLGQRLLEVWAETDGECADGLLELVDALAEGGTPQAAYAGFVALEEEYDLPRADEVFAVGYPIEGVPARSVAQIEDGLRSVCPLVMELADDDGVDLVAPFAEVDGFERRPLGERFADWLARERPGVVADLARYEAALRSAGGEPEAAVLGTAGEGFRIPDGARVLRLPFDPVALARAVESGAAEGLSVSAPAAETTVLILRAGEELVVAEVPEGIREPDALPEDVREGLLEAGLLVRRVFGM